MNSLASTISKFLPAIIGIQGVSLPEKIVRFTTEQIQHISKRLNCIDLSLGDFSIFQHMLSSGEYIIKLQNEFIVTIGYGAFTACHFSEYIIQISHLCVGHCRQTLNCRSKHVISGSHSANLAQCNAFR